LDGVLIGDRALKAFTVTTRAATSWYIRGAEWL